MSTYLGSHQLIHVHFVLDNESDDVDELTWLWDITTHADKKIIVDNWKGLLSRYYKPGPFSNMENAERMWTEWILQELQRD